MKVALVHDYLIRFGGAERVLLELAGLFPEAPIYTFLYDQEKMRGWFGPERVRTSFLQKFPKFCRQRHRYLLPFLPAASETFDLREFDLVISSASAFAKGVITRPKTIHINYCHNPARFLWDYASEYVSEQKAGFIRGLFINLALNYLRIWDRAASRRVDYFIANSRATAGRIKKYYRREAKIIYPPVDIPECEKTLGIAGLSADLKDYFLIVSQLSPYKKIDIAIEAFNKLELPLVIIGDGPQKKYLEKIAKNNVKILGWQPDEIVGSYFKNCVAFVFPGEDDFGIAPVQAMKFGKPVLALKRGGAKETVLPGITGEFFEAPTVEALADGVRRLRENLLTYSALVIRKWGEKFSTKRFRGEIMDFIRKILYNQGVN